MTITAIHLFATAAAGTIATTALVFFTVLTWISLQAFGFVAAPM